MADICSTCGLPDELCVCADVSKDQSSVEVHLDERRYGKEVTIVEGLDDLDVDVKSLASELKSALACGGTYDDDYIELQGDHLNRIDDVLDERGFEVTA